MSVQDMTTESVGTEANAADDEVTTAPVVLHLDGLASTTTTTRCIGDGVRFLYINANLVYTRTDETIAYYRGSGNSEGCSLFPGTIYMDIVNMVENSFSATNVE